MEKGESSAPTLPAPAQPRLSLLPHPRERHRVVVAWEVCLPAPSLMSLVEQVLLGRPASNLHT